MSAPRPPAYGPLPRWLYELGLSYGDVAGFGPDLRLDRGALLARHRDAAGHPLGWERITAGPDGRLCYRYPRDCAKGTVCSRIGTVRPTRLLLACGPLLAVCARRLDGARPDTVYMGLGGCWTAAAAASMAALIGQHLNETEVVLAFAANQAGEISLEAAVAFLWGAALPLRRLCRRAPPAGSWPETLRRQHQEQLVDLSAPA